MNNLCIAVYYLTRFMNLLTCYFQQVDNNFDTCTVAFHCESLNYNCFLIVFLRLLTLPLGGKLFLDSTKLKLRMLILLAMVCLLHGELIERSIFEVSLKKSTAQ